MNISESRISEQVAYFKPYKGHIHNPGMGIISMAISDHMVTGYSAEQRAVNDMKKPFKLTQKMLDEICGLPFIDNLYIRVGWNDVQKTEGKLDIIPEFEMAVDSARKAGITWGFRIMQASPSNEWENLLPDFLKGRLPLYPYYDGAFYGPSPKYLPLYTDEYLQYWSEMLQMLGEKYDSDLSLVYGDVSGFGLWGEGHHGCHIKPEGPVVDLELDSRERKEEIVDTLINSHRKAFPQTPMVLNLVLSEYGTVQNAIQSGCWVRRDSYYRWFTAEHAARGLMKRGDAAMIFETVMPGIEIEDSKDAAFRRNYMELPDKMCDYGAAYGIVGFNPMDTLYAAHMMPGLFDTFSERVGYRLRPSVVWKATAQNGKHSLILGMVNDGSANPPGVVGFTVEGGGEKTHVQINGEHFSGRMYLVELPLPENSGSKVELSMTLTTGGKCMPARFAADTGEGKAPEKLHIFLNHE